MQELNTNPSTQLSYEFINAMIDQGIIHYFVSPGMRNLALIQTLHEFQKIHKSIQIFEGIDERSSAFRALGLCQSYKSPVCLICTSGSALTHYYPAIVEAFYQKIPLIVVSADRPAPLVKEQAHQCIDQRAFFQNYAPVYLNLNSENLKQKRNLRSFVNEALAIISRDSRPAHFNIAFDVPIDKRPMTSTSISSIRQSCATILRAADEELIKAISSFDSLLVFGAFEHSDQSFESFLQWAKSTKRPFFLDVLCPVRYQVRSLPPFDFSSTQQFVKKYFKTIIHFGKKLTSNAFERFLDANPQLHYISIDPSGLDPYLRANKIYQINLSQTFQYLEADNNFENSQQSLPTFQKPQSWSVYQLAQMILDFVPSKQFLFLGNSLSIRAFDFLQTQHNKQLQIFAQRGTSGIDGHLSHALGLYDHLQSCVLAVIGDISFLHDINTLYTLQKCKDIPLIFVIANNGGGKIFQTLSIINCQEGLNFIQTPHQTRLAPIIESFGHKVFVAHDQEEFSTSLSKAFLLKSLCFIEAVIDGNKDQYEHHFLINSSF